jgi:PPOX class probable F420-dependent enzyme
MPVQFGPRLKAFLDEPNPAILGTTRRDHSVQMTPVWFEYRDSQIWVNGGPQRDWFKHMRRDGRVTLLVLDTKNMFRYARVQARLVDWTTEGADEHIEHLSQRYFGRAYPNPKIDRLIIRIEPDRVTGMESGQPWDVSG